MRNTLILLLLAGLIGGCKVDPLGSASSADRSLIVRTGVSFGECLGYCWRELIIDPAMTTWTELGTNVADYPARVQSNATTVSDWAAIREAIDISTFRGLDPVYGCPDCADGGAEWIEVEFDGESTRVVFEFGNTIPPITALTQLLRTRRANYENR